MGPSSPKAASISTLIFSGGEGGSGDPYETQICEGERMAELSNLNYDQETGEHLKRESIYMFNFLKLWIDVLLRAGVAVESCSVHEQGKGGKHKMGQKGKSKGSSKKRRGKARDTIESDSEEEDVQRMCESEDDADALPVAPIPACVDDIQDEGTSRQSTRSRSPAYTPTPSHMSAAAIIKPSTPLRSPKKRKFIAEVVISTPSPRKKIKFSQNSDSSEV